MIRYSLIALLIGLLAAPLAAEEYLAVHHGETVTFYELARIHSVTFNHEDTALDVNRDEGAERYDIEEIVRLEFTDHAQSVDDTHSPDALPTLFSVGNAYPNPFNASTHYRIDLPEQGAVRIALYDRLGREVEAFERTMSAGSHSMRFDAKQSLASGVYFLQVSWAGRLQSTRLVYMR